MDLESSYLAVQKRIVDACHKSNRNPESIKLIAASKGQSLERIAQVHNLGQIYFGENYALELIEKKRDLPGTIEWSFIGQLQSNKIKRIMAAAHEIQSVASLKHVRLIAQHTAELGLVSYPIFLEVTVPEDTTKSGFAFEEIEDIAEQILEEFPQIALQGVMAIPPQRFAKEWNAEGERLYKELRQLANGIGEGKLSLGMSADLEQAIACGSDIVRIGSALMGPRNYDV